MYKQTHLCKINYKKEIAPGVIDIRMFSKAIADSAKPGQFLNIKCSNGLNALLRRPISICDIDKEKHEIRFIFQVKGEGTKQLAGKKVGDTIDVLGPLGTPFQIDKKYKHPLLIGGGIGIFPLLLLLKTIPSKEHAVYLGFRNKEMVVLEKEFRQYSRELSIATDDGSYGIKGYVTQLMAEKLKCQTTDIVYACGPEPMLKQVKEICSTHNIPCQLSMEQRMGCGIGACLVCACKTKKDDHWEYRHVCKDGPIFWGDEVVFDE